MSDKSIAKLTENSRSTEDPDNTVIDISQERWLAKADALKEWHYRCKHNITEEHERANSFEIIG